MFPWVIGRAVARQLQLAAQLDATRRELAEQALLAERRRIARDVHDLLGHGLAAVMLQVTSARHVLRRDPAAAEEALRSAEDLGRRSMQELRRTVALLRSDEDRAVAPPAPVGGRDPGARRAGAGGGSRRRAARPGGSRPDRAGRRRRGLPDRAGGARERGSSRAAVRRTVLGVELDDGRVCLDVTSSGPVAAPAGGRQRRDTG